MMQCPFLVGENVYLRPLMVSDLDGPYLQWLNDREVTRFTETGVFPTTRDALQQYLHSMDAAQNLMLAIVEKSGDRHVGNIKLGPISWIHRRANMGIAIGDKEYWGRGFGREAVALLLGHAFDRLNLHKVCLGVDADHQVAIKLYESLGFTLEATEREQVFREGAYRDHCRMGILRREYQSRPRT